eukprot:comp19950_c0_seq1/m.24285 comp19950_c0_seq1/g.24285  ORF comp19950_c0_seq1/g.24285 comp19950_c0_seq1/m.24285 type:complete len:355 (-) comp19950_c0_seq1:548-1612(-)
MARKKKEAAAPDSKKPENVAFKQQKLKAWQPVLAPKTVLPVFLIIGLTFIPLGVVFLIYDAQVVEVTVDYTTCMSANYPGKSCADVVTATTAATANCQCLVRMDVPSAMNGSVYLYYQLGNYYQNHRRYVKSRDDAQLNGQGGAASTCDPLATNADGLQIAPCGYIANSMFNDTIFMYSSNGVADPTSSGQLSAVALTAEGISWRTDADQVFKNPASFSGTTQPPAWTHNVTSFPQVQYYPELTQGYTNLDLIVWMRTAALPTFRKLYRRLKTDGLQPGTYYFNVTYNYPVVAYEGRKALVLTTLSFLGNKNSFLGIGYVVVGAMAVLLGAGLLFKHLMSPRQLGDHKYLSWDR